MAVQRISVDLSAYPDLVMILLGMRTTRMQGLRTLFGLGPLIGRSASDRPDGLLHHETFLWSLYPVHLGIRQYWRDFGSLEAWARSAPHRIWWQDFLRDPGGTGFWHETYFMRGGVEAIFDDMPKPQGLAAFAPALAATGPMFSARQRAAATAGAPASAGPPAPAGA